MDAPEESRPVAVAGEAGGGGAVVEVGKDACARGRWAGHGDGGEIWDTPGGGDGLFGEVCGLGCAAGDFHQ